MNGYQNRPGQQQQQRPRIVQVQNPDPLAWQPFYPAAPTEAPSPQKPRRSIVPTVVALALLCLAGVLALIFADYILGCLGRIRDIGVSSDRGLSGFAVLGVVLVAIVAAVKIFAQNRRD